MRNIEELLLRSRGAGADDLAAPARSAAPLVKAAPDDPRPPAGQLQEDASAMLLHWQRGPDPS